MAGQGQDFRELQDLVEGVSRGSEDAASIASVAYRLRQALPRFLGLLQSKVMAAQCRTVAFAAVQARMHITQGRLGVSM